MEQHFGKKNQANFRGKIWYAFRKGTKTEWRRGKKIDIITKKEVVGIRSCYKKRRLNVGLH